MYSKYKHPLKNGTGTLVDYNLSIIMLPSIISGVSFGGIFIRIMPDIVINSAYVIVMSITGISLTRKLIKIYRQENVDRLAKL